MTESLRDEDDIPHVIAPPPLIYLVPLIGALLLDFQMPRPLLTFPWTLIAGVLLIALSGVFLAPAIAAFRAAKTKPQPWKPTTALVAAGPYRISRNPMYVAFTMLYAGLALWMNTVWPFIVLPVILVVMQFFVIHREERYLDRKFGEEYRAYRSRVRRWL
jgi:protein-S-isoprenylcysteine O-methyltransferase Ste14